MAPEGQCRGPRAAGSRATGQIAFCKREFAVYVVAGTEQASPRVPATTVPVTLDEYDSVLSAMPR